MYIIIVMHKKPKNVYREKMIYKLRRIGQLKNALLFLYPNNIQI